jgi:hypothetical protein
MITRLLEELASFVQRRSAFSFLRLLFVKDHLLTMIDAYQARIGTMITAFQVYSIPLSVSPFLDRSVDICSC